MYSDLYAFMTLCHLVTAGDNQWLHNKAGAAAHQRFLQGQLAQPDVRGREPSWAQRGDGAIGH